MLSSLIATILLVFSFIVMPITAGFAIMTRARRFAMWGALAGLFSAAFGATVIMDWGVSISLFGFFAINPLSAFFIFLAGSALALVAVLAFRYSDMLPEFFLALSLSFFGMFVVATAQSLLPIVIGLELMTVSTTFMVLVHGKRRAEAAVKLFIFGSLAIAILGFATSLVFQYDSSLALTAISANGGYVAMLSLALFIAALGFETASFPFNLWIPDVYQGAPAFVSAALAGVNKKIAFLALIYVLFFVFAIYAPVISPAIEILSIFTMLFGNLLALKQQNLKRLFAYSSISQAGYILVGIATASPMGLTAALFYIFSHSFMIIGAFAIVELLESHGINTVDDCNSLYSRNAFVAISLTIIMLSMIGVPGLIGFFGKFLLFTSAISAHMFWLAVIAVASSFLSIYYYARVMNAMFQRKEERTILIDQYAQLVIVFSLAIIFMFGIFPQPLIHMAQQAVAFIPKT